MNDTPLPLTVSAMSALGRSVIGSQAAQRRLESDEVMAVAPRDVPAECTQPLLEIAQIVHLVDPGVRLNLVVVDDRDNLAEACMGRRRERLPELPFLQLAVASQHEHAAAIARQPVRERHPLRLRDAHAEGTRVGLHVGRLDVRMARQSIQTAQVVELVLRQEPEPDQHGVQGRRVMALG